jgi:hypothetical protein
MLISYPTPQIAAASLKRIEAARQPNAQQASGGPANLGTFYDKRSGPIVAVVTGAPTQDAAKALLGAVNYDADVTWNENTYFTKKDNVANLLVNVIVLCGIIGGLAIVAGIAFGGLRVLFRRLLPEQVRERQEGMEFIALHLSEKPSEPVASDVSHSIKAS